MSALWKQLGRTLLIFVSLIQILVTPLLLALPLLLLITGETAGGRMVGGSATCLLCGLAFGWLIIFRRTRIFGISLSLSLLCASLGLWLFAVNLASGENTRSSLKNSFTSFPAPSFRGSLANVVPEIDQLKLGTYLLPHSDPLIDSVKRAQMQVAFLDVYREMREDREFVEAGSALGRCYEDLFLGIRRSDHRYEYFPPAHEGKSLPVIIFLHGSLGNFKGYAWALKSLADSQGIAIIAPTFGTGNWEKDGGQEVIEATYRRILKDPRSEGQPIILAGLSNGGRGVTREMRDHPERYAKFILISPVLEPDVLSVARPSGKPVLIIQGAKDKRIPEAAIKTGIEMLKTKGFQVDSDWYPEDDHFLFFSKRDEIAEAMGMWLSDEAPIRN